MQIEFSSTSASSHLLHHEFVAAICGITKISATKNYVTSVLAPRVDQS
jgi:hypothetical protein